MEKEICFIYEEENFRLKIIQDNIAESPRTSMDNLGTMVCWHRRGNYGDEHNYYDKDDFWLKLANELGYDESESGDYEEDVERHKKEAHKRAVILPIYMLDHSGVTISTTPFNDRWDSGKLGFIFVSLKDLRQEYGDNKTEEELRELGKKMLQAEVEIYDQYLRGDVYGFVFEKLITCECCKHTKEEEINSCWGFYEEDIKENGILDHIESKYHTAIKEAISKQKNKSI